MMNDKTPYSDFSFFTKLHFAVSFLTRFFPLPAHACYPQGMLAASSFFFPVAGLLVGALSGAVFWLFASILPPLPASFLALLASALATGALHEDGLADMADGLGGKDIKQRLSLMKDSRIGAFGVLALIFSVGLRSSFLAALSPFAGFCALLVGHTASRTTMLFVMYFAAPARPDGLAALAGRPKIKELCSAFFLTFLISFSVLPLILALLSCFITILAALLTVFLAQRKFGGITGDILGASQQIGEILMLGFLVWGLAL